MKRRSHLSWMLLGLTLVIGSPALHAQTYVWDGSTATGYQNTNGTWGSDNLWTISSGANSGTVLSGWTFGATAWFGGNSTVAASPSGNFTNTVNGTQTAAQVRQVLNGAGDFTLTGGTLELAAGGVRADRGTFTVDSVITNSAATLHLNVQSATGLLVVGGDNTYTATSEIRGVAGGTVRLNNAGALGTGSSVQFVNSSVLLDLHGFDVSGKTITVSAGQTGFLGNTAATKSTWSGTVTLNTTGILRAGGTGAEVDISGIISGSTGSLQSFDGGTLRLSGDNTYSGGTSVRDGSKLIVGHTNALGSVSHTNFIQAATLDLNGFDIGSRIITLQDNASRLVNDNTNAAAAASGPVNMLTNRSNAQIGGDGNLTLSGSMATQDGTGGGFTKVGTGTLTLGGSNNYTGTTTISGGGSSTLRLGHTNALGSGTNVQYTAQSFLDLNGFSISGKTLAVNAAVTGFLINTTATKSTWAGDVVLVAGSFLRAGGTNAEVEISGAISGSGGLQSFDGGTLRVTGDNTYSGTTSVRNGSTLIVGHSNALGSVSHTNFIQASTLDLNGFDIGSRIITLQDNASRLVNDNTNAAAASGPINMLTNRSNAQIGGDGNLTLSGSMATQDGTGGGFTKVGTGTLTLGGSNNYTGTTTVSSGTLMVSNASLTATIQSNSVAVAFTNTPTNGTYAVLPGPVGAASFASNSVTGLGGKTATMTNSPNLVVLVSGGPTGSTFKGAYPSIIDPSEINPANGLSYLMNYALGGTESYTPNLPALTSDGTSLTLTANIRNSGQGVSVVGEYAYDLAGEWWTGDEVLTTPGGPGSVEHTTVHSFSINVEPGQPRKFLRLKATSEP